MEKDIYNLLIKKPCVPKEKLILTIILFLTCLVRLVNSLKHKQFVLIFVTETISRNNNCLKTFFISEYLQIIFFLSHNLSSFPFCPFESPNLFK